MSRKTIDVFIRLTLSLSSSSCPEHCIITIKTAWRKLTRALQFNPVIWGQVHAHQIPPWPLPLALIHGGSSFKPDTQFCPGTSWLGNYPSSMSKSLRVSTKKMALLSVYDLCSWHRFSWRIWQEALCLSGSWYLEAPLPPSLPKSTRFPALGAISWDRVWCLLSLSKLLWFYPLRGFRKVTTWSLPYLDDRKHQWVNDKVPEIEIERAKFESSPFLHQVP